MRQRSRGMEMASAARLAEDLVQVWVLAADDPPRFVHPVIQAALEASLGGGGDKAKFTACSASLPRTPALNL